MCLWTQQIKESSIQMIMAVRYIDQTWTFIQVSWPLMKNFLTDMLFSTKLIPVEEYVLFSYLFEIAYLIVFKKKQHIFKLLLLLML